MGITVVVTSYNYGRYLEELVSSVAECKLNIDYELLIVDDHSEYDEGFLSVLESSPNVRILRQKSHMGVQAARNRGIQEARYDYILQLDGDDKLGYDTKGFIETGVRVLEDNPAVAFCHGYVRMFGEFDGFTSAAYPVTAKMVFEKHHVPTSIIYRREDAIGCRGYNIDVVKWQDWAFGVALLDYRLKNDKGTDIFFWRGLSYHYRAHSNHQRISQKPINELEQIRIVVKEHIESFRRFYPEYSDPEVISRLVLKNKPTYLMDLLHTARDNLDVAKQIIHERKYVLKDYDE